MFFRCHMACLAGIVLFGVLSACGGGSGSAAKAVDNVAPAASITFPPSNAFTDAASITVTGTASDSSSITAVQVNGINASTSDGFSTWQATVPLLNGLNTLTVATTDSARNSDASAAQALITQDSVLTSVGAGPIFGDPARVAIDDADNRALVTDNGGVVRTGYAIIAVDFANGNRSILSDAGTGTGPDPSIVNGIVVDPANNRALFIDRGVIQFSVPGALFEVDLDTGDRNIISDMMTGGGVNFLQLGTLALDSANNRVFVTETNAIQILEIDLTSGFRTILSDNANGSGPLFADPEGIALDAVNNRLLVTDTTLDALFAVDITTGNRSIVSNAGTGAGTGFSEPADIVVDAATSLALVSDTALAAVLAVDLTTGDRLILSDMNTGGGIDFSFPLGMAATDTPERLIVIDSNTDALYQIEPISGDRVIVSR